MKTKKTLLLALSLINLLGLAGMSASADTRHQRFGAIAYSESSGRFGSSWQFTNQYDAEQQAVLSSTGPIAVRLFGSKTAAAHWRGRATAPSFTLGAVRSPMPNCGPPIAALRSGAAAS